MKTETQRDNIEKPSNILLPEDKDFLLSPLDGDYEKKVNVTYRWPRKIGNTTVMLVSTSTISVVGLNRLRVEEVDGQYFVVNEPLKDYNETTRFCVVSESVGHAIIKAIIELYQKKPTKITKDDLDIDQRYWKLNKIAEEFSALIFTACGVTLTLSAAFWLLFK